ncbi:MAG: Tetratricopeptide repeat [Rhizobium sp.]|nr:Tetratricopeptide repeat [Rhizobium sp.]
MPIAAAEDAAARLNVDAAALAKLQDLLAKTAVTYDVLVERCAPPEMLRLIRHRLSEFHLKLARMHLAAGNTREAIDSGEQASALQPGDCDTTLLHVSALLAGNDTAKALPILVQASMVHSTDAATHALLAQVLLNIGRASEAVASFRLALDLLPEDEVLKAALANALAVAEVSRQ